ncbi:MAG: hypothetical protein EBZ49_14155, partial [Proteobacteria bacterium]|nr:hypothetical protein [Pseudomonadota bacterium]
MLAFATPQAVTTISWEHTGFNNNFFGRDAGRYNTTGNGNNFLGQNAGYCNCTGNYNNFFGREAGFSNTTGNGNNFFGYRAGFCNTTGGGNNFLGYRAGYCIGKYGAANNNTFIGTGAGTGTYDGNYIPTSVFVNNNFAAGYRAGFKLKAHTYHTYYHRATQHNVFIGFKAGYNSTTDNNYGAATNNNFLGYKS